MAIKKQHKDFIDNSSYEELMRNWRFCQAGDPLFQGESGEYYMEVMARKKKELNNEDRVAISKRIGWG